MATTETANNGKTSYTLYYNTFSICSIMIRYLIELRGEAKNVESAMDISLKEIDISRKQEQFSEQYLCEVNPKGQVPVLANPVVFDFPLAETVAISQYICERYPALLPQQHAEDIKRLVHQMHEINYFTLTFRDRASHAAEMTSGVTRLLEQDNISDRYRQALEYKLDVTKRERVNGLAPDRLPVEMQKSRELLEELRGLLRPNQGPWMYGYEKPTELDAHLVVFLARLGDIGLDELVPEDFKNYRKLALATREWASVMGGQKTTPPQ